MKDWQNRVINEAQGLGTKIVSLTKFLYEDVHNELDFDVRYALERQKEHMENYHGSLLDRIDEFEKTDR